MCYGSVQHIAVYTRASFMKKLQELLDDYENFESLENVEKSSYVLGSELWESKFEFDGLLALVNPLYTICLKSFHHLTTMTMPFGTLFISLDFRATKFSA